MIVKPTVNELLKHIENRYALVIATSKRAREIANGDKPLVDVEDKSPVTIAADEIAEGKVYIEDTDSTQLNSKNLEYNKSTENSEKIENNKEQ